MAEAIRLPAPRLSGGVAVELAQLLWAAQGVTSRDGRRTAPSARALYPLEVYVVAGSVTGLPAGVFRYVPADHRLDGAASGDRRRALAAAALGQDWLASAPVALVIARSCPWAGAERRAAR